ncbi:MAG: ferredoxin reductase [Microbacteriaceae bacterium]|nr:ferredoxin reductase [Microbacteriaceae bacterium]
MSWRPARVVSARRETSEARTVGLDIEGWPGHVAGQHVDVRLTAEDGYTAVRSYSISSSAPSGRLEITVDRLDDGEVSPYLIDQLSAGDRIEIRGPSGGWFVWRPETAPAPPPRAVQLIGGGSGIVPLMSMIRTHAETASVTPFRLLYSVRSPALALFRDELMRLERDDPALQLAWAYSRAAPEGWPSPPARLDRDRTVAAAFPPPVGAEVYVCGASPFVESVTQWLVEASHPADHIKTERYGG